MRSILSLFVLLGCGPSSTVPPRQAPSEPPQVPGRGPEEVVPAAALEPGACDDAPLLTIDQLLAGEGANQRIAIDVVPQASVMCTAALCIPGVREGEPSRPPVPPDEVCCNSCGGSYVFKKELELLITFQELGTCSGMDCNYRCEPFGIAPTTMYRFVGTNDFSRRHKNGAVYDKSMFTVEKYCRVAPST